MVTCRDKVSNVAADRVTLACPNAVGGRATSSQWSRVFLKRE